MSANFAAGNCYLVNTAAPVASVGFPLAVGMWVRPASTGGTRRFWSLSDPLSDNNHFYIGQTSGNAWVAAAVDPTNTNGPSVGTVTAGAWAFVLTRLLTAKDRTIDVLQYDGSLVAAQVSVTRNPAGCTQMGLGARVSATPTAFFNGLLAEFWYSSIPSVLGVSAALSRGLMQSLAYGGPFSVPSVGASVIEYRSLRKHPTLGGRRDVVTRGIAMPAWANSGGVTVGVQPPLRMAA